MGYFNENVVRASFQSRGPLILAAVLFGVLLVPYLSPLALAGVFALGMRPVANRLQKKYRLRSGAFSATAVTLLVLLFTGPLTWLAYDAVTKLPKGKAELSRHFQTIVSGNVFSKNEYLQPALMQAGSWIADTLAQWLTMIPEAIFVSILFLGALYLFLSRSKKILEFTIRTDAVRESTVRTHVEIWQQAAFQSIFVNALLGSIQAAIITIGAMIFTEHSPVNVFIVTFFLAFIPILGAGSVGASLSLITFLNGQTGPAVGMFIFTIVCGVTDNILLPLLVTSSDKSKVHPVIALVALIGGIKLMGFPGLFIAPTFLAVSQKMYAAINMSTSSAPNIPREETLWKTKKPSVIKQSI